MGGLEALKAMRQKAPSLKVVVVTADVQARTLAELKAEGAFEVLRKPADRALVLSSFERATHPGAGK
jgi:DNA-binding NtrC family response regulator